MTETQSAITADTGVKIDDVDALRRMLLIRRFEEAVWELYRRGQMPGLAHLSIGHEAVAVGTCGVLNRDDYILSTHRGHGHCIGKGAAPTRMMAEMLGKATGYCGGRGGTMHIADLDNFNLGAVAIVGAGFGLAAGVALACKRRGHGQVVVAFIGEGAMNQGVTHEAMNLASIWKLPVVFVCENNLYSEYTFAARMTSGQLTARAEAHQIPAIQIDGMDYRKVRSTTEEAVDRARRGDGATFIENLTYRIGGHHVGDQERYRTKEEVESWRQRDPIEIFSRTLVAEGRVTAESLETLSADVQTEIDAAIEFAVQSPFPDTAQLEDFVYG